MRAPFEFVIRIPKRDRARIQSAYDARARVGGKAASATLLKPVRSKKRVAFLRWFLEEPDGRSFGACMVEFRITRANVLTYWQTIQREHGIGYAITNNMIIPLMPPGLEPGAVFGEHHGA